uniref:Uncharacterized protein n=1 Tax=Amphimedon queenslandica TaxID=400682 RepID=A0A1X7UQG7_AMPQE
MKRFLILLLFLSSTLFLPVSTTPASHCQSILEEDSFCTRDPVRIISISINGTDGPHCITDDSVSCKSLNYTLNQINLQASTTNTTWLVLISSDQLISSVIRVTFDIDFSCLILCGDGSVTIFTTTVLSPVLELKSKHNSGNIIISNLTFDFNVKRKAVIQKSVIINAFQNFIMINSFVTKSSDWKMTNIRKNITIISSSFTANHFDRALLELTAPSVYMSKTMFNHSLAQLTDNFISKISTHSQLEELIQIIVTGCSFTKSDHLFTSVISIASNKCKNHFESDNSLISIDTDSTKSTVELENSVFYDNTAIAVSVKFLLAQLTISNSSFEESKGSVFVNSDVNIRSIRAYVSLFSTSQLISVENSQVSFYGDIIIEDNVGTALKGSNSYLTFEEWSSITIRNNTALKGGGLSLSFIKDGLTSVFEIEDTATVEFNSNVALLGGAVYIDLSAIDEIPCSIFELGNISFVNNSALTKGNDVLFDYGPSLPTGNCTLTSYTSQLYYDVHISSIDGSQSRISVFPGQFIRFKSTSTAICEATVYLTCNGRVCPSQILPLSGSKVQLLEKESTVTTDLTINRNISDAFDDIQLHLICQDSHKTLTIDVTDCPLGFFFDSVTATCKCCSESVCDPKYYQCSLVEGEACIKAGNWFGKEEDNGNNDTDHNFIIHLCYYPYCLSGSRCQIKNEESLTFVSLPEAQDEQCLFNKGKKQCKECRDGYHFTYLGVQCVKGANCGWNLLGLILLAIIINVIVGLVWIGIIKFKGGLTFGISLGPLIFIAFGRLEPFGAYEAFEPLEVYFSILSLFILDNSILGYIPACTPISTGVGQQLLNYIGPLVIIAMIVSIVIITNCCPRYSNKMFDNPLQVICLLALVTFWSLARTSNSLLLPLRFGNRMTYFIDPNVNIVSNYTFIWLLVIPIYVSLYIVIIFMILSPFLAKTKRFNTVRMKAVLDVCQSCYKDKWRWCCSLYFGTWIVSTPLITYPASFSLGAAVLIGATVAHFVFQPYSIKWLNVIDTLLLVDLQILCSIVCDQRNVEVITNETAGKSTSRMLILVVYCLCLIPVACYAVFGVWTFLRKICFCKKIKKSVSGSSDEFYVNVTMSENHQLIREKMEPKDLNVSRRSHVMARDSILYDLSL